MKKLFVKILSILVASTVVTSCATMFGDNNRTIKVDSQPSGAGVFVNHQRVGTTPAVVTLPSHIYGGANISLKKEGYEEQALFVQTQVQPSTFLNIFFWPGFVVDGLTGNIIKINPVCTNLSSELQPVKQ